ncbi:MAG: undecaprenyldiphospho-muramoylpentapeptide beta-N-acetylglucosaminyltransferase [Rhodospirillaceae bacterium]|nr:undecaprenyldiphospho-muramoylpentapeptide beta-N-acetylglucosaminyltransferase [Rhodospirillaceae bacterium]
MAPLAVLAAGGTGGHVFPAEALAAELSGRGFRLALITDRRGGGFGGALADLETHHIRAGGIAGKRFTARIESVFELGLGMLQARSLLAKLKPDAVIGFGGYASVPTMMAATWAGLATAIHEQNGVLGRANRLLATRVRRIATSIDGTQMIPDAAKSKVRLTGMPVRPAILAARDTAYAEITDKGPLNLLVTGGSQGARVLSDVVPAALAALNDNLKKRLTVTQQCRAEDLDRVGKIYDGAGIKADLKSFFDDVPQRLAAAHLVIARAGASSVAEMTAVGRPSILVPLPHAIDNHQFVNAQAVDEAGAGWLMAEDVFTAERLAGRLASLFENPRHLSHAATAAKRIGRPDAAHALADLVAEMIPNGHSGEGRQAA